MTYKLASAGIAEPLKEALLDIINEDQTGFIPGRYMGENLRLLYDFTDYTNHNDLPGLLLLIGLRKLLTQFLGNLCLKQLETLMSILLNFPVLHKTPCLHSPSLTS